MTTPEHQREFEKQERGLRAMLRKIAFAEEVYNPYVVQGVDRIVYQVAAISGLGGLSLLNSLAANNTGSINGPTKLFDHAHQMPELINELLSLDDQEPSTKVRQTFENFYWYLVSVEAWEAIKILEEAFTRGIADVESLPDYQYRKRRRNKQNK